MVIYGRRSHLTIVSLVVRTEQKRIIQRIVHEIKIICDVMMSAENLAQELDQDIGRIHLV